MEAVDAVTYSSEVSTLKLWLLGFRGGLSCQPEKLACKITYVQLQGRQRSLPKVRHSFNSKWLYSIPFSQKIPNSRFREPLGGLHYSRLFVFHGKFVLFILSLATFNLSDRLHMRRTIHNYTLFMSYCRFAKWFVSLIFCCLFYKNLKAVWHGTEKLFLYCAFWLAFIHNNGQRHPLNKLNG